MLTAARIYAELARQGTDPARDYVGLLNAFLGFYYYDTGEINRSRGSTSVRDMLALIDREFPALERWAREHPSPQFQLDLEGLRFRRWRAFSANASESETRDVEERLLQILQRVEKALQEQPSSSKLRYQFGRSLHSLAIFYNFKRDHSRAVVFCDRAIAIWEKLVSERPDVPMYKDDLAYEYCWKGFNLMALGRYPESEEMAARAIGHYRSALRLEPLDRFSTHVFADILGAKAETLMRHGRHREALPYLEENLALDLLSDRECYQLLHALSAANLGDLAPLQHHEATIRAILLDRVGMENEPKGFWITYFDAASVYAALAKLDLESRLPPVDRQRNARTDRERALACLEKARTIGEFKGFHDLDQLRRDPILDDLRSDPRYQNLMMDLSYPDDPFRR
jgi:tetratricopeptide (TPR) repeat protein